MTLCPECRLWAATTRRQLINRVENMANNPTIQVHPCPKCKSTEWVITDEMIQEETHSWGYDGTIAILATLSAIIIIALVLIGWWR